MRIHGPVYKKQLAAIHHRVRNAIAGEIIGALDLEFINQKLLSTASPLVGEAGAKRRVRGAFSGIEVEINCFFDWIGRYPSPAALRASASPTRGEAVLSSNLLNNPMRLLCLAGTPGKLRNVTL